MHFDKLLSEMRFHPDNPALMENIFYVKTKNFLSLCERKNSKYINFGRVIDKMAFAGN